MKQLVQYFCFEQLLTADHVQTPAGMPAPDRRGAVQRKLGLLNICAACENMPPADVALIALAACDDACSEVCVQSRAKNAYIYLSSMWECQGPYYLV